MMHAITHICHCAWWTSQEITNTVHSLNVHKLDFNYAHILLYWMFFDKHKVTCTRLHHGKLFVVHHWFEMILVKHLHSLLLNHRSNNRSKNNRSNQISNNKESNKMPNNNRSNNKRFSNRSNNKRLNSKRSKKRSNNKKWNSKRSSSRPKNQRTNERSNNTTNSKINVSYILNMLNRLNTLMFYILIDTSSVLTMNS